MSEAFYGGFFTGLQKAVGFSMVGFFMVGVSE